MHAFQPDPYNPAPWLPNGHWQTVYASLLMPAPRVAYRREIMTLPDSDIVAVDSVGAPESAPFHLLIHGMEGDSQSRYARFLMAATQRQGWAGAVLHMRSCGGVLNREATFYHAGWYRDLETWVERFVVRYGSDRPLFLTGISLGGSQLIHFLSKSALADHVTAAATVSTPLDLAATADYMSAGLNRLYIYKFRQSLVRKYRAKRNLIKNPEMLNQLARARDFWELDNAATAPLHGFRDAAEYYAENSAGQLLPKVQRPLLMLASRDDPFLPADTLPLAPPSQSIQLHFTKRGGHVGFVDSAGRSWMTRSVLTWFDKLYIKQNNPKRHERIPA